MTENEKQLTEQVAAVAMASADVTARLVQTLVGLKKISPSEGVLILGDLAGHNRECAKLNEHISGYPPIFLSIADRLQKHKENIQERTGATVEIVRGPKP